MFLNHSHFDFPIQSLYKYQQQKAHKHNYTKKKQQERSFGDEIFWVLRGSKGKIFSPEEASLSYMTLASVVSPQLNQQPLVEQHGSILFWGRMSDV